jgi:uncharacterized protein (DUF1919 family)
MAKFQMFPKDIHDVVQTLKTAVNVTRLEKARLKNRPFKIHLMHNEEVEIAVREWLRNLKYIHRDGIFLKLVSRRDKIIIVRGE